MNARTLITTRNALRVASVALMLAGAAGLSGCATPATQQAMVPTTVVVTEKHAGSVAVNVTGGKTTSAAGKSQISDEAFKQAIVDSINKSQVFASVGDAGSNYQLTASIISMDQPSFGLDFTVKMEAGWTLKRVDSGAVAWQEVIKSQHTATTSDAFAGVTRLRMANEGAARNNISQALEKISKLKL